jgi:hypothetical protein
VHAIRSATAVTAPSAGANLVSTMHRESALRCSAVQRIRSLTRTPCPSVVNGHLRIGISRRSDCGVRARRASSQRRRVADAAAPAVPSALAGAVVPARRNRCRKWLSSLTELGLFRGLVCPLIGLLRSRFLRR